MHCIYWLFGFYHLLNWGFYRLAIKHVCLLPLAAVENCQGRLININKCIFHVYGTV